jgi:hypothetical protein
MWLCIASIYKARETANKVRFFEGHSALSNLQQADQLSGGMAFKKMMQANH